MVGLFSGCVEKDGLLSKRFASRYNYSGIMAPEVAYFGEEVEFDASKLFSVNNGIKKLVWNFGDGEFAEGTKVRHTYSFNNEFDILYPLIYSVSVLANTDSESFSDIFQIKIYPKGYLFFFDSEQLLDEKPSLNKERIGTTGVFGLNEAKESVYEFGQILDMSKCNINVTLSVEKPLFLMLNKIEIILIDENDNEVLTMGEKMGLKTVWKQKTLQFSGTLDKDVSLKSVKISFYGFSIGERIKIIYGGDTPSTISFEF